MDPLNTTMSSEDNTAVDNNRTTVSVKAHFQNPSSFRRFPIPEGCSFSELKAHLNRFLPCNTVVDHVQYQDDEGDWIGLDSDSEWEEALRLFAQSSKIDSQSLMRLKVFNNMPQDQEQTQQVQQSSCVVNQETHQHHSPPRAVQSNVVHYGITCDGCCQYPIKGIRHKCNSCPDFDLCHSCYSLKKHAHHTFTNYQVPFHSRARFNRPNHQPLNTGVVCDGCKTQNFAGQRYKCMQCPDYDLCFSCFQRGTHSFHNFKIISPSSMPHYHSKVYTNKQSNKCRSGWDTLHNIMNAVFPQPPVHTVAPGVVYYPQQSVSTTTVNNNSNCGVTAVSPLSNSTTTPIVTTTTPIVNPIMYTDKNEENVDDAAIPLLSAILNGMNLERSSSSSSSEPQQTDSVQNSKKSTIKLEAFNDAEQVIYPNIDATSTSTSHAPAPEFSTELQLLSDMGLTNSELCLSLLRKHSGDLSAVVSDYFNVQQ